MKYPRIAALTALLIALAALPAAAQAAKPEKNLYLSLGDSLSVGVQPTATGGSQNTKAGFANRLARKTGARLVNLGCGFASSESFIRGGRQCAPTRKVPYKNTPRSSQLTAAEKFLRENRGRVRFVTIDIGANDVAGCGAGGAIDIECVNDGIAAIEKNGPVIARRLRKAAGSGVPMAVMTLYDPFLESWFDGGVGAAIAEASVDIARDQVNPAIVKAFRPSGFKIARVDRAFDTYRPFSQTTTYGGRNDVPVAVARICRLTWMCTPAPRGPDIHANARGYEVIARTFRTALGRAAR